MGGQGGGVLADWIVELAENQGWVAQSTSVPGVAQRTGATIYYIEMLPPSDGPQPILSLMPTPGDVDVVMAAELMEAGRSILRGLVTPDRTTLIASTHRAYAVAEKNKPGDGIADPDRGRGAIGFRRQAEHRLRHGDAGDRERQRDLGRDCSARSRRPARCRSPRQPFEAAISAGGSGVEGQPRAFRPPLTGPRPDAPRGRSSAPAKRPSPLSRTAPIRISTGSSQAERIRESPRTRRSPMLAPA